MARPRDVQDDPASVDRSFELAAGVKATTRFDTSSYNCRLWTTDQKQLAIDEDRQVALLLYGQLYEPVSSEQPTWCLKQYLREGFDFSRDLNGSFVIVVIDALQDHIAVITDRLNTRRAFASVHEDAHWVSNCLFSHPLKGVRLDPIGVAWSIVNKAVFNNRTLFEGVRVLERASINELMPSGFDSRAYWTFTCDHSCDNVAASQLKAEFSDVLIESVRRQMPHWSRMFLSLSAGYDASAVLGILRYILNVNDVECFTFVNSDRPAADGDACVSRSMAELAGYTHRMVRGYEGNILDWISRNGSFDNGLTQPSNEIDGLLKLSDDFNRVPGSVAFTGVQCFGFPDHFLQSREDVLNSLQLFDPGSAPALMNMFNQDTWRQVVDGLTADRELITRRYLEVKDLYDLKDILYVDQRVNYYILPEKEYYMGDFIHTIHPFLDNAVVDFMMKVPIASRLDRYLYRNSVTEMLPQLFAIKRAATGELTTDWAEEFEVRADEIKQMLFSQRSILDEFISPQSIVDFMEGGLQWKASTKAWINAQHRIRTAICRLKGTRQRPPMIKTGRAHILRRVLALRSFLNKTVDHTL
ncbi:MAG: hypothetical protein JXM70_11050 [Pirellulales bacterium]|nr:hypothetical protein [Pirellulales bacterium]